VLGGSVSLFESNNQIADVRVQGAAVVWMQQASP